MLSQNTRPDLLHVLIEEVRQNSAIQRSLIEEVRRHSANQDKLIEVLQQHSTAQSNCLAEHDNRLGELEKKYKEVVQILHNHQTQIQSQQTQLEESQESADYAVREVRHLTHLLGEKEALEERVAFYCPPD